MPSISDRIFHESNLIAVYADQTAHSIARFGTSLDHDERRLGYVKITDLVDASKRGALIQAISSWLTPSRIERHKIAALQEQAPKTVARMLRKTSEKTELFATLFPFLSPDERESLRREVQHVQEQEAPFSLMRERADVEAVEAIYDRLIKRPELSIDQIFAPLEHLAKQFREIEGVSLSHFNPMSVTKAAALAAHAQQPEAFASSLLDAMLAQQYEIFRPPTEEHFQANGMRERQFLHHFDGLPDYLKELFVILDKKTVIGTGTDAYALTRTGSFHNLKPASGLFSPTGDDILYSAQSADKFSIIAEEIIHAIDKELMPGRTPLQKGFTYQAPWHRAVDRHLGNFQKSKAFQQIKAYHGSVIDKANTFYSRRPVHIAGRYAEALPDVMHVERELCGLVREHGNLSCIGFRPQDTVDQALRKGMGDLYLLYRRTPEDKQLWQAESGEVTLADAASTVEGAVPVESFQDRCHARIRELSGKAVSFDPHPTVDPERAPARLEYPRKRIR